MLNRSIVTTEFLFKPNISVVQTQHNLHYNVVFVQHIYDL